MGTLKIIQNATVLLQALIGTVLGIAALSTPAWYIRSAVNFNTVYGLFDTCNSDTGVCQANTFPTIVMNGCTTSSTLWKQTHMAAEVCAILFVIGSGISLIIVIVLIATVQEPEINISKTFKSENFMARLPSGAPPRGWRRKLRVVLLLLSLVSAGLGWSAVGVFAQWYSSGLFCGSTPCLEASPIACSATWGYSFAMLCIAVAATTLLFFMCIFDVAAVARKMTTLIRGRTNIDLARAAMSIKRSSMMTAATMVGAGSMSKRISVPQGKHLDSPSDSYRYNEPEFDTSVNPAMRYANPKREVASGLQPISKQPIYTFLPPEGDWATGPEIGDLFWSEGEQLFFDPNSGQFYDPHSEHWYDPDTENWYQL